MVGLAIAFGELAVNGIVPEDFVPDDVVPEDVVPDDVDPFLLCVEAAR